MSDYSLISRFEQQLLEVTNMILAKYQKELKKTDLTVAVKRMGQLPLSDPKYCSEVVVEFYSNRMLADILEFFAWKDGAPHASLQEAEEWLNLNVQDVIQKQRERLKNQNKVAV